MRQMLRIAAKDLKQRVRDRSVFIVGIIAPAMLALIFTFAFGDALDPSDADGGTRITRWYTSKPHQAKSTPMLTRTSASTPTVATSSMSGQPGNPEIRRISGRDMSFTTTTPKRCISGELNSILRFIAGSWHLPDPFW